MGMKCRRWVGLVLILGLAVSSIGLFVHRALAQRLPFERNKVEPIDPRQAFVEGYQAYRRGDWPAVIERMQLASSQVPDLIDYALFFQGRAQRENGDLAGAAATLQRLTASYPQSVLADQATVDFADLELKLLRPDLAVIGARTAADRTDDPGIEQQAHLLVARALQASGDFHGAYAQAQSLRERYPNGPLDAQARALAYEMIGTHPSVTNAATLEYKHTEGALLLREGRPPRLRSNNSRPRSRRNRRPRCDSNWSGCRRAPRAGVPRASAPR